MDMEKKDCGVFDKDCLIKQSVYSVHNMNLDHRPRGALTVNVGNGVYLSNYRLNVKETKSFYSSMQHLSFTGTDSMDLLLGHSGLDKGTLYVINTGNCPVTITVLVSGLYGVYCNYPGNDNLLLQAGESKVIEISVIFRNLKIKCDSGDQEGSIQTELIYAN